jgi:hypothetical protein
MFKDLLGSGADHVTTIAKNLPAIQAAQELFDHSLSLLFFTYTAQAGQTSYGGTDMFGRPVKLPETGLRVFAGNTELGEDAYTVAAERTSITLSSAYAQGTPIRMSRFGSNDDGSLYFEDRIQLDANIASLGAIVQQIQDLDILGASNTANASAEAAEKWATQEGTPVSGNEYSAKHYAGIAQSLHTQNEELANQVNLAKTDAIAAKTATASDVVRAEAAKSGAEDLAGSAQTAAHTAGTHAQAAETHKNQAEGFKNIAEAQAQAAAQSAINSSNAETTSTAQATAAEEFATFAAEDAAKAQTARIATESFRDSAGNFNTTAREFAIRAEVAEDGAKTAESETKNASVDAVNAKNYSETYANAARQSELNAESFANTAQQLRDEIQVSANTSAVSATAAEDHKNRAAESATLAQGVLETVYGLGQIYASIEDGLGNTAPGQLFSVAGAGDYAAEVFLNDAGTGTPKSKVYNAAALDRMALVAATSAIVQADAIISIQANLAQQIVNG